MARRVNPGALMMVAVLAALVTVLLSGGVAQAAPQYAVDCTFCHQMPPLDSGTATKNPATGAVPGSHQGHATSAVSTCVKCHGAAVATYPTGHRNKAIELEGSLGYSRAFVNQTSVPPSPLGTCATASCHFGSATPAWGSALFSAPGDCAQCHEVAPNTGNHPVGATKHALYYGTGVSSCEKCHSNHLTEAKPFAHATSSRAIAMQFATFPNSGGTFAANQCSALYCHSNGSGGAPNTTPTWGGTLDCKGCHNSDLASGAPMASSKHDEHINNAAVLGTNYGCVECHAATVSGNTTIADVTRHVNTFVDFSGAKAGNNFVAGNCSTTYCHSDGKGIFKTAGWTGAETLDCQGCHGSDSAPAFASIAGEPNYASGAAGSLLANTHQKHVAAAADCVKCHSATTDTGTSIKAGAAHTNKTLDVVAGGGKSFDFGANKTCSNISCHSGDGIIVSVGSAQWGGSLGCAGCHGDAGTLATNAHATHVAGKGYACATCHSATVAAGNSPITDPGLHGNSAVNVAGSFVFTSADKSCAVTCHLSAAPQWNVAASGACGTCHAALPATGGLIGSNGHTAHYSATYGPSFSSADATACATCHVYTTDLAATHADGAVNIQASLNYGSGKCTTCHQQTANWTGGRASCESCHTTGGGALSVISGVTAPDKTLTATAGHGNGAIGMQCTDCHDNNSAHISGTLGDSKRLAANLTGGGNTECSFCHNDPGMVSPPKLNMQTHVATATSCAACHDPHGTANSLMVRTTINSTTVSFSGADFVKPDQTGLCQVCHTSTIYYKNSVAETNHPDTNCLECHQHNSPYGDAFEPNRECDSCHGYPPAPRVVTTAVTYGVQGNWSSARFEDYSGGGGAHLVAAHLPKDVKPADGWTPCLGCHSGGAATHNKALPMRNHVDNVSVKVDPQYRFSNDYFIVYTSAKLVNGGANETGSCYNVSCHFKPTQKWSIER